MKPETILEAAANALKPEDIREDGEAIVCILRHPMGMWLLPCVHCGEHYLLRNEDLAYVAPGLEILCPGCRKKL